jgi:hypothetical protein
MFIILGGQRCGSHLIGTLLDSHPHLTVHNPNADEKYRWSHILPNIDLRDYGPNEGTYVPYIDFVSPMAHADKLEAVRNMPTIHVRRRDKVAQVKSYHLLKFNYLGNQPHPTEKVDFDAIKINLSGDAFAEARREILDRDEWIKLTEFPNSIDVWYEDICGGDHIDSITAEQARPMLEFLGVEPMPLHTDLVKVGPYKEVNTA